MSITVAHSNWPLALPRTWRTVKLGALAERFLSGGTPSTKDPFLWQGDIPWITSKWLDGKLCLTSGEKCISRDAIENSATSVVPRNSLIFATRVGVGKVSINKVDLAINQDLAGIVISSDKCALPFVAYQLRSDRIQKEIESHKRGATIKGITRDNLKDLELWLPPLSEQRKIASVLILVQRAIEQQERLIALMTELKKSLMHKLFTEGLRGERQKQTDIGSMPESWKVVPLENLLREPLRNGHSAKATNNGNGIRTLTLTAVTQGHFSEANTKLTSADPARVSNLWLVPGDILIERANTLEYVGLAALYEGPEHYAIYPDLMIRVRVQDELILPYLIAEFLITSPCRTYFQRNARSTAGNFPKIDQGTAEKALIPVPAPDEQEEIVAALRSTQRKRDLYAAKYAALMSLFRTLLHQLMTAQIRVHDLDLSGLGVDSDPPMH